MSCERRASPRSWRPLRFEFFTAPRAARPKLRQDPVPAIVARGGEAPELPRAPNSRPAPRAIPSERDQLAAARVALPRVTTIRVTALGLRPDLRDRKSVV